MRQETEKDGPQRTDDNQNIARVGTRGWLVGCPGSHFELLLRKVEDDGRCTERSLSLLLRAGPGVSFVTLDAAVETWIGEIVSDGSGHVLRDACFGIRVFWCFSPLRAMISLALGSLLLRSCFF